MIELLRRISLPRLLALCAATVAVGAGSTAIALAVTSGPTPPPQPLADAIHAALQAPPPSGVSARVKLVNHLFEGSEIAAEASGQDGGPLIAGGEGRLWIDGEGDARLELQSESGATQIIYDHGTVTIYDAANAKLYRYTPPAASGAGAEAGAASNEEASQREGSSPPEEEASQGSVPTVAKIESELTRLMGDLDISGAQPTDVAEQPAYAATVAPRRNAGLFGDAELAWDSRNGTPLRLALYAKGNPSPAVELTATEVSFEAVPPSVFTLDLPSNVKETTIRPFDRTSGGEGGASSNEGGASSNEGGASSNEGGTSGDEGGSSSEEGGTSGDEGGTSGDEGGSSSEEGGASQPREVTGLSAVQAALPFTVQAPASDAGMIRHEVRLLDFDGQIAALICYGEGLGGIAVVESVARGGGEEALPGGMALPRRTIDGAKATELPTELGTVLTFSSGGIDHLLLGSVTASTIEAAARGL